MQDEAFQLVGASGAIAAITTAYLALFPRSHVTVLVWIFFFVHFFEWPAMLLIGLKIIVWDNIIAPGIGGTDHVAYQAHLAGYLFGFLGALVMLFLRAVPRDQFDILALWRRWHLRREFRSTVASPAGAARARYGSVAQDAPVNEVELDDEDRRIDEIAAVRTRITAALEKKDNEQAMTIYEELIGIDPHQCLAERHQLAMARVFYDGSRFQQAAAAFARFLESYPRSTEAPNVRLLLGIIYARDLRQYEIADTHLTQSMEGFTDKARRAQAYRWLRDVRAALGRTMPELDNG